MRLLFSIQNLTRLVTSLLWLQNSIDWAVSYRIRLCSYEVGQPGMLGWLAKVGQLSARFNIRDSVSDTWANRNFRRFLLLFP